MTRIVITDSNLGDGSHERAELGEGYVVEKHDVLTEDEVIAVAANADGILVQWAPITERVLAGLPQLRAVVRYGIGIDNIDTAAASRHGVAVSNVDDYCIDEVADQAAAAVYAQNRRLVPAARSCATNGWTTQGIDQPRPPGEDPVGIAGFGRIGQAVGERLSRLGFPVHVWDPFLREPPDWVTVHSDLVGLARAAMHLTMHIPLTPETAGLVDAEVLAALGPHGHLVNTARGGLVDERALVAALDAATLGFATLDVLAEEPPSGTSADLAGHDRVMVTPHTAYLSTRSLPQLRIRAARRLATLLAQDVTP